MTANDPETEFLKQELFVIFEKIREAGDQNRTSVRFTFSTPVSEAAITAKLKSMYFTVKKQCGLTYVIGWKD